jgi:hypothetical protein
MRSVAGASQRETRGAEGVAWVQCAGFYGGQAKMVQRACLEVLVLSEYNELVLTTFRMHVRVATHECVRCIKSINYGAEE